nr:VENN motif pre-toxin domain-containing protein [Serratia sp. OS31]
MDIVRTQGDINGLQKAKDKHPGLDAKALRKTPEYQAEMQKYGTGSDMQRAAQAVTGVLQALAGNNLAGALASGAAPYLAREIKARVGEDNVTANAMAHALLGAITAQLNNQSAVAGAVGAGGGELAARVIVEIRFPGRDISSLTEGEKQEVSALSQLAAGLAGGIASDSTAGAVTASQASKNATENNFLSVSEKTELELAKQKLQSSKDPAEREQAQQKVNELREKDIASDKAVIDACSNGNAGSSACAGARLKAIEAKEGYEGLGNYNSKASQQYADAYGQIVNLLNITSVDAQNKQQIQDAMINFFMTTKGVDYATAKDYAELKQGADIIIASVTPILGAAAAKQLGKIVDANVKVVAKGNVDGSKFTDTNQGIRPSQLADFNKPTLINDVVQAKIVKEPNKNFPNGNMGTAHAEIGVIQQAYEKGMTNGKDMLMSVSGEALCTYCLSDVKTMAAKSGLKSLTIYEEKSGDVLYWESGMKKFIRK